MNEKLKDRLTYRAKEVCQLLGIGKTTLYAMEKEGQIPKGFMLTERIKVWNAEEIKAWLKAKQEEQNYQ